MRLPRQIPPRIAMELALTGDFISAQRGYEIGFVNRVVEGPAIDGALELAHKISANGPLAVRVSKQVIVESRGWTDAEMWAKQQEIVGPVMTSQDAREGAAAFAQKRAPNWTGK
jgi:enoyl-CoA hydratase